MMNSSSPFRCSFRGITTLLILQSLGCAPPLKAEAPLILTSGDELKLVYPQASAMPDRFEGLGFRHFLLQPMDGPRQKENIEAALAYCLAHPRWRLSVQTHKGLGIR